jgi:hypothetical protein
MLGSWKGDCAGSTAQGGAESFPTSLPKVSRQEIAVKPLFTIITPALNAGALLADALASVRDQADGVTFEHLLLDGGSTDNTLRVAAGFDFVAALSKKDGGLYDAMNKGAARASGEARAPRGCLGRAGKDTRCRGPGTHGSKYRPGRPDVERTDLPQGCIPRSWRIFDGLRLLCRS